METVEDPIQSPGRPVLLRSASRDVTQQHRAESLYRFLIEHLPNTTVFLYDRSLRFVLAEGFIPWASGGSSTPSTSSSSLWSLFPSDVASALEPHFRAALDGQVGALEETFRLRSYRIHFLPVNGAGGGEELGMAVFLDVTEEKATLAALQERTADLERSNRDLEQFANVASHELKAPLRRISSFADLLRMEYGGVLSGEADAYLGHIIDGVRTLQGVIESLLTYSRVRTDKTHMDWVDIPQVYDEAVKNLAPMLGERGAQVQSRNLPDLVTGDEILLRQLLENLIGNAVKFNTTGRRPQVFVECRRDLVDWVFSVRDNGPGLGEEYREKAFTMFSRLRPEIEGHGIGLALCKKIVGIHRGRIWYESVPNVGTTFFFTLPARSPDETTGETPVVREVRR